MRNFFLIPFISFIFCFFIHTNDQAIAYREFSFYNTYNGVLLTPQTVAEYARSELFAIKDIQLLAWIKKHKTLLKTLAAHVIYQHAKSVKERLREGNRLLKKYNLKNSAIHNFIFSIKVGKKKKKYWIKIAGPHRLKQLDYLKAAAQSEKEIVLLYYNTPVYHNASRFARYLLYKKWTSQNSSVLIKVPKTYIFSLSDKNYIDDNHCVVIEEDLGKCMSNRHLKKALLSMEQEIKDFVINMGFWDVHFGQFVMTDKGEVFCIDLEDPESVTPEMFFHQNYDAIKNGINRGLRNFKSMMSKIGKKKI